MGADKIRKDFFDHANSTVLNISASKCSNYKERKCLVKISCLEQYFLADQLHERKWPYPLDVFVNRKLKGISERQQKRENQVAEVRKFNDNLFLSGSTTITDLKANIVLRSDSEVEDNIEDDDDDYVYHEAKHLKETDAQIVSTSKTGQMLHLAVSCDKAGVPDRSATLIASSVLQNTRIVFKNTPPKIIDKTKLRRERRKVRVPAKVYRYTTLFVWHLL